MGDSRISAEASMDLKSCSPRQICENYILVCLSSFKKMRRNMAACIIVRIRSRSPGHTKEKCLERACDCLAERKSARDTGGAVSEEVVEEE